MEYEIYLFCNVLGAIIVCIIVLFHFVEADKKIKTKSINEDTNTTKQKYWRNDNYEANSYLSNIQ